MKLYRVSIKGIKLYEKKQSPIYAIAENKEQLFEYVNRVIDKRYEISKVSFLGDAVSQRLFHKQ